MRLLAFLWRELAGPAAVVLVVFLLFILVGALAGCQAGGKPNTITNKQPGASIAHASTQEGAPAKGAGLLPTGDSVRAEREAHRAERDALASQLAAVKAAIVQDDLREAEADADEDRARHRREAAIGKALAGGLAALSILAGIFAWTPWGWWLPKWAGPFGLACASGLLLLAAIWPAANDHALGIALCLAAGGITVGLIVFLRVSILAWIRHRFGHALEQAETLGDVAKAKADSLAAELRHGVHKMGQAQRRKPPKGRADLARLRAIAAADGAK